MPNFYEVLEGEFYWTRFNEPETMPAEFSKPGDPPKKVWKTMFKPNSESLTKILDLQAKGVKNKLGKGDDGKYFINFNRPVEIYKKGKLTERLDPPKVFKADGQTPLTDFIGNGSKGKLTLDVYEHKTKTGSAHAARIHSAVITDFVPYQSASS